MIGWRDAHECQFFLIQSLISHTPLLFHCVELGSVSHVFLSFLNCDFKKLPPIPWDKLRNTLDICLSSKYCSPHAKNIGWIFFCSWRAPYTTNFLFVKGGQFEKHNAHSCELFILKNACYCFMFYPTEPI